MFSCVTSLAGTALGTLLGGSLLEAFSASGCFTGSLDRYKVLVLIALVLRLTVILVMVPRLNNDVDFDLKARLKQLTRQGTR